MMVKPFFFQEVDIKTGYKTRSMMCHPILDSHGEVIAVAQVINKGKTLHYGNTGCGVFKGGMQN